MTRKQSIVLYLLVASLLAMMFMKPLIQMISPGELEDKYISKKLDSQVVVQNDNLSMDSELDTVPVTMSLVRNKSMDALQVTKSLFKYKTNFTKTSNANPATAEKISNKAKTNATSTEENHTEVTKAMPMDNSVSVGGNDFGSLVSSGDLPTIYVITPTYPRTMQLPELTRLSQTLMLVPKVFWIVAEDADNLTDDVTELLSRIQLPSAHLLSRLLRIHWNSTTGKPKGVANRLAGLKWVRENASNNGVVYLADDDNTYDIRLFEEIRNTKKVSMFPVGLVARFSLSTPIVRGGKVIGFYDGWIAGRKYPVDMAGFAVNVEFLKSRPNATMPFVKGYEEDGFLKSLNFSLNEIEPLADNCKKILVWHTQTVRVVKNNTVSAEVMDKFGDTNLPDLIRIS